MYLLLVLILFVRFLNQLRWYIIFGLLWNVRSSILLKFSLYSFFNFPGFGAPLGVVARTLQGFLCLRIWRM